MSDEFDDIPEWDFHDYSIVEGQKISDNPNPPNSAPTKNNKDSKGNLPAPRSRK